MSQSTRPSVKAHALGAQPFVVRAADRDVSVVDYSSLLKSSLAWSCQARARDRINAQRS